MKPSWWAARPIVRFEAQTGEATAPAWLRIVVIAVGAGLGALFLASQADPGSNPFNTMWISTFGSVSGLNQVITLGYPLILAGCAVFIARRVGLWNIGVDGQMYIGAWLGTALAFSLPDLSAPVLTAAVLLAGVVGGALWAAGPVLMHTYFRVNEVVTTLLLNFVAASWVLYWVTGVWANKGSQGAGSVTSRPLPDGVKLGALELGSVRVGLGCVIAVVVVLVLGLALRCSRYGFRASLIGADEKVARYAGFSVRKIRIGTFLLSGAVGGLAGVAVELGQVRTLSTDLSTNTGYFGIVVAVLAGRSLAGTIPMGLLVGALAAVGVGLQLSGVSSSASLVVTGLLLILAASADAMARYRPRITKRERAPKGGKTVVQKGSA